MYKKIITCIMLNRFLCILYSKFNLILRIKIQ